MKAKFTRRQLALAALSMPAVAGQTPAPPPLPQTPDQELQAARSQNRQISEQLAKFPLPMTTEPAVHFKA
ncbi:MAG TPA: hypothetical protein VKX49_03495 [Bryobacteraceae bacterium]|nr:hypothetical protein [Bryobacteraceae bacterium]